MSTEKQKSRSPALRCGRLVSGGIYKGYRVMNHGYYAPDRCIWWEAQNLETGEADFHAHSLRELRREIDSSNIGGVADARHPGAEHTSK
jgi:hypothetical protein